ncbi:unnamed protein product, partial [Ilex paraguariensis]
MNNQSSGSKDSEDESSVTSSAVQATKGSETVETIDSGGGEEEAEVTAKVTDDPMEEDLVNPATVFCIKLKQPRSNLQSKMSLPELCRNF